MKAELYTTLIDLALDTKDKKWFMRLISKDFLDEISVSEEYDKEIFELNNMYSKACNIADKAKSYSERVKLLKSMNRLRLKYKIPVQNESLIEEYIYYAKAHSILSQLNPGEYGYDVNKLKPIRGEEAFPYWVLGESIYLYTHEGDFGKVKKQEAVPAVNRVPSLFNETVAIYFVEDEET